MFNNIGSKIKTLAVVITVFGMVASFLMGFLFIINLDRISIALGLLIIIGGSLLSWVGCFVLYGFGELIHNVTLLNNKIDDIAIDVSKINNRE